MPQYFQKPENALKRANEFIVIGKKEAALDVLYDVIKSKKHRNWQKIHEPILQAYLGLCIDLKRSVNAKEGLYQYKLICQQVNIASLEEIISFFLQLAEKHAEEARNQSIELVTVEDLDQVQTPEGIMLSSVSSEDAQDRSDRVLLTPWVKFLWEAYRNVLELLRNNNRVERLYHETAQSAFKFCLKYQRRAEFRKLCVLIKNHLDQVLKYQGQPTAINLNAPESLQMHLETRLFQLENAITMELWQEAFRAIEGIHYLMQMSKKPPKPHMMANYYEKVALVFFKAENKLFHAAALLKLFTLIKDQKKTVTPEELKRIGSKVLLASLSINIPPGKSSMEEYLSYDSVLSEKDRRLATLLGLISLPTRKSVLNDVENIIIPYLPPELKDLFYVLESKFNPLQLCKKVNETLTTISSDENIAHYVKPIQEISIIRALKQISQVYESMSFERLMKMIPFADIHQLEHTIVMSVKKGDMQISINHQSKSLTFGSALVVALKEEVADGPYIQAMPSEILRSQLCSLAEGVNEAYALINPETIVKEFQQTREQLVSQYMRQERKEHMHLLNRKSVIEARKEKIENMRTNQERLEKRQARQYEAKLREAEEKRLEIEREKREKERRVQEMKEIQKQQVWDRVESLRGTDVGKRAFKNLSAKEIDEMDPEDILQRQYEQLDREKREQMLKLRTQEKRIDHLVRAMRMEEIPLLEKFLSEKKIKDEEDWEREEEERIKNAAKDHQLAIKAKDRLQRMQDDKEEFLNNLFGNRHSEYEARLQEFDNNLEKVRKERLEQRKKQRMAQRRQDFITARREQKRKEREEQSRREKEAEEERKRKAEEEERIRREEKRKALDEVARKQREKEAEIEEKLRQQQSSSSTKYEPPSSREPNHWRREDAKSGTPNSSGSVTGGKYVPPSRRRPAEATPRDFEDGPRRDDRGFDRRDDRGFDRRDDRGIDRRDDRGFDRRDDRGFDRRDDRGFDRRDDRGFDRRDDRGFDRRDDRGFDRRDDRGFGRREDRGFERRDDRNFERRDDRGFDRRDERGDAWRRDNGGRPPADKRDDRFGDSPQVGRSGGWRGDSGNTSGGGSWRSSDGGRSEGRSWQASRVRSDRDREDKEERGPPRDQLKEGDEGWTTVTR
ncbi:eukaryotic translation initiation factor 3 subunit A-like [Hydractinia symbiolongicarpus]|uniref:eukaryotic translation initiation factor 3 subunit A-like n=1 Tax=Hydractinia symbiolongicarpus TaxID=13093 RepID=UPI00254A5E20|nr:eukaryotic translation initiation factor 3 subunit A-like [Hydractinia symbiolongicarpus]